MNTEFTLFGECGQNARDGICVWVLSGVNCHQTNSPSIVCAVCGAKAKLSTPRKRLSTTPNTPKILYLLVEERKEHKTPNRERLTKKPQMPSRGLRGGELGDGAKIKKLPPGVGVRGSGQKGNTARG